MSDQLSLAEINLVLSVRKLGIFFLPIELIFFLSKSAKLNSIVNLFHLYSAFPFETRCSFLYVVFCYFSSHTQIKYIPMQVGWS